MICGGCINFGRYLWILSNEHDFAGISFSSLKNDKCYTVLKIDFVGTNYGWLLSFKLAYKMINVKQARGENIIVATINQSH